MTPFRLEGQTALITGGGTGIGLGIARCFVHAGAQVVLVGRREQELDSAVGELGPKAFRIAGDITRFPETAQLIDQAESLSGPLTILVNNAGIHIKKPTMETTTDDFESVLRTHVLASHALTSSILPRMISRQHGSVLFIASMASLFGIPNVIAYSAAKSAYLGMIRTLATEVSHHGIRINGIAPGWIDSAMMRKALDPDPDRRDRVLSRTPMGRFGEAADVGWAAVYLCSPAAKFLTGAVLPVDGGISIGF